MSLSEKKGATKGRHVNLNKFKKDGKNNNVKNIGRKTRRKNVENGKWGININKIKNGKNKLLFKVFKEFKLSSSFYKEYSGFNNIEKNLKNNLYLSLDEFVKEIRNTFSQIFYTANISYKYNKIINLCESFEKIYKKYDNKLLLKESENLLNIINILKRKLRQTEKIKNSSNINIIDNNKSYKSKIIKFDVNTISFKQLKQLGREVNKIKGNNKNNNYNSKLSLINKEC